MKLLSLFLKTDTVAGIKVKFLSDNNFSVSFCKLRLKKGIVTILQQEQSTSLAALPALLEKRTPVVLVVEGKGVLHRKVKGATEGSTEGLVQEIFPNIKADDLFIQRYAGHDDTAFISVARRQLILDLLEALSGHGIAVADVSFGPFIASSLFSIVGTENDHFVLDDAVLHVQDGAIVEMVSGGGSAGNFRFGEDEVSASTVVAYAAALNFFTHVCQLDKVGQWNDIIHARRKHWENDVIFKNASVAVAVFFFAVLFLNAAFYFQLFTQNQALSDDHGVNIKVVKELSALKTEVERNQTVITTAGWMRKVPVWFYADRLAATIPEGIRLTELDIYPLDEKVEREKHRKVFEYTKISVSGICAKPVILNEWLRAVRKIQWVGKIADQTYNYKEREKNGYFNFSIIVKE
jgi:hypothetical protein